MPNSNPADVVEEFVGYNTRVWAWCLYQTLAVLTAGLFWLLGWCVPQLQMWTLQKCTLSQAHFVHAKVGHSYVEACMSVTCRHAIPELEAEQQWQCAVRHRAQRAGESARAFNLQADLCKWASGQLTNGGV